MTLNINLLDNFEEIITLCKSSKFGKHLPQALYIHILTLKFLPPLLQEYEQLARDIVQDIQEANLIKFNLENPKISYLFYPNFDINPHPFLQKSILVDLTNQSINHYNYENSDNPPILHRKETFVTPDYPFYEKFTHLTKAEESLGLLDNSRFIGTREKWLQLLKNHHIAFEDHYLICPLSSFLININIDRHKAALIRNNLSRPMQIALEANLFTPESIFFDYGCGHGGDIARIAEKGYKSSGWDPFYRSNSPLEEADIVNLGYVINVIENVTERREALLKAWGLTRQILIVSAQVLIDDRQRGLVVYNDGIITEKNTFQKYFEQEELKSYIDQVLQVDSIPVALGIYIVFKNENMANNFRASRFHSKVKAPRVLTPTKKFEDYQELLTPLMNFYTERGRLPVENELPEETQIKQEFRSFRNAFKVIFQVTKREEWEAIADKRRQEILIYLALSHFTIRPTIRKLPTTLKTDIKALFSNYQAACFLADEMLISLRNLELLKKLARENLVGKIFEDSFLIHLSVLDTLPSLLRLYEGCASRTIGRLDNANLVQFYFNIPKISYLYYPDFDTIEHPILETIMTVNLQDLQVKYRDFYNEYNPPILHEKDKLVNEDYPLYKKFAKLTKQEKKAGLLRDFQAINRLKNWQKSLKDNNFIIEDYQLIKKP